eukprot:3166301-Prymnesium_polylepis.1
MAQSVHEEKRTGGATNTARARLRAPAGHRPAHDSWLPRGTPASLSVVIHSGRSKSRRPKAPLEAP